MSTLYRYLLAAVVGAFTMALALYAQEWASWHLERHCVSTYRDSHVTVSHCERLWRW